MFVSVRDVAFSVIRGWFFNPKCQTTNLHEMAITNPHETNFWAVAPLRGLTKFLTLFGALDGQLFHFHTGGSPEMDASNDLHSLIKRLEKVERQNRAFKTVALVALLAVGSLAFIAARPVNVQTAEKFVVVDSTGKTIATLGADADGLPGLSIKDIISGKERAWLGLWNKGQEVSLGFYDRNSKERSRLGILANGLTRLNIDDENGKLRAWLGQSGGGKESGVGFYDGNEKERAWFGIAQGTTPRVILYDPDHKESWSTP
jgi:hypothetical protein